MTRMSARAARLFTVAAAFSAAGFSAALAQSEPDLRGVWRVERYAPAVRTVDGAVPPLKPEARALYERRAAARAAGGGTGDPVALCQPAGVPRALFQDRPFMIVQTPAKVTILHEFQHAVRHVYMDEALDLEDKDPAWDGYSVGRWDGDALVVETGGFNGKTWLDEAGLPHSEKLKVTERIRRLDADTLEARVAFEDPDVYAAPWSTRVRFKRVPGGELGAHICTETLYPEPPNARPRPQVQGGPPGPLAITK